MSTARRHQASQRREPCEDWLVILALSTAPILLPEWIPWATVLATLIGPVLAVILTNASTSDPRLRDIANLSTAIASRPTVGEHNALVAKRSALIASLAEPSRIRKFRSLMVGSIVYVVGFVGLLWAARSPQLSGWSPIVADIVAWLSMAAMAVGTLFIILGVSRASLSRETKVDAFLKRTSKRFYAWLYSAE